MMKSLLAALLLLCAFGAQAATVTNGLVSCTDTISATPTAPQQIFIDCTATTGVVSAATKPFHSLLYRVNFGDTALTSDPNGTAWANAANTTLSKNQAAGAVSAHVYQTAGTYTWTVTVSDGTVTRSVSNTNVIASADTTFAGAATTCYYNTTLGTGCPADATDGGATDDFDGKITSAACNAATKRCLFKGGDTFTSNAPGTFTAAGPNMIGSYGIGNAIIATTTNINAISLAASTIDDLRIVDLTFQGTESSGSAAAIVFPSGITASGVTMLRLVGADLQNAGLSGGGSAGTAGVCNLCVLQESAFTGMLAGMGTFGRFTNSAILGNLIGPCAGTCEFPLRLSNAQKTVISFNTLTGPLEGKNTLSLRAIDFVTTAEDTFYVIISDNHISTDTRNNALVTIDQGGDGQLDARHYDIILERNLLVLGAYTGANSINCMALKGTRVTVRNNICNLDAATVANGNAFTVAGGPGVEVALDINIYNNTLYSSKAVTIRGASIAAGATETLYKNNLCYFPNTVPASNRCLVNSDGSTIAATNSTDAQTISDPAFDGPLTSIFGWRIGTGSYAAENGTAIFPASNDDFFRCDDVTANEHIGAAVSRVRARCRGVAGP